MGQIVQQYASQGTEVNENRRQQPVSGRHNIDIESHTFPFLLEPFSSHKMCSTSFILGNDTKNLK